MKSKSSSFKSHVFLASFQKMGIISTDWISLSHSKHWKYVHREKPLQWTKFKNFLFKQERGGPTCDNLITFWNRKKSSIQKSLIQIPNNIRQDTRLASWQGCSDWPTLSKSEMSLHTEPEIPKALSWSPPLVLTWPCGESMSHEVALLVSAVALSGFPAILCSMASFYSWSPSQIAHWGPKGCQEQGMLISSVEM